MSAKEEVKKMMALANLIYATIVELGGVPSGHLYARLMGEISLDEYNFLIDTLKKADLITEKHHYLEVKRG